MKRQRHEWRERTEEGEVRLVRASCFAGKWEISSRLKHEDEYVRIDPPTLEDLEALREKLWAKYQRNRVPYKNIVQVEALIEETDELAALARDEEE